MGRTATQAEADAWIFRTTEVLEGGGSDAAQLRHGRQARKRMATDARDSRHISEAGGLMMSKQPRKSKDSSVSGAARGTPRRSQSLAPSESRDRDRERPVPPRDRPQHPPIPANLSLIHI